VVEAQKPEFLPLDLEMEAHIPADRSSFAYRKGLRAMGFSPFFCGIKSFDDVWPLGIRNSPLRWVSLRCSMIRKLKKAIF